jgi:hypothetical protein
MRKWTENIRPGDPFGNRDYSMFFVRPGVVLGRPGAVPDLPGNVTITISKQGASPAKIVVTRDHDKWEVSEGELGKLPADLRPHVEAMLRHPFRARILPEPPEPRRSVDKQLEEMSRRLDEMRKAVEELKQKQSQLPAAPAPK